jgi:hypothetical protein
MSTRYAYKFNVRIWQRFMESRVITKTRDILFLRDFIDLVGMAPRRMGACRSLGRTAIQWLSREEIMDQMMEVPGSLWDSNADMKESFRRCLEAGAIEYIEGQRDDRYVLGKDLANIVKS